MPIELGYVTIPTPNVPRAKLFFGPLFGWKFEQESGEDAAHVGNTQLPLGFSTGGPVDYVNLYFRVSDIAAMVARVIELGGGAGENRDSPSGLSAACHDGQGTAFSLWQPAPGF